MDPRPLLELNVQQAIASILQKPRWWMKWHDQEIRAKWLDEVEMQFLLKTFDQSLAQWYNGHDPLYALDELLEERNNTKKHEKLMRWLQSVIVEFKKGNTNEEEEDDGEEKHEENEDEGDVNTKKRKRGEAGSGDGGHKLEKRRCALENKIKPRESYPTVKWTFNQLLLHERLSTIPMKRWTKTSTKFVVDAAYSVNDPSIPPRAAEFVLAIRRGASVEEALPLPSGSTLLSADRKLKLKLHCEKIHHELAAVRSYITKYIELVAKKKKTTVTTDPAKVVISPAGVDGVWISDNIISNDVATKFINEVAALENVRDEEKDWHPHSERQVLDLVHPSLFCCVFGETTKTSPAADPTSFSSPAGQMHRLMFTGSENVKKPQGCNTEYQWIPTDVLVDGGGKPAKFTCVRARILSYINNLHPDEHEDLYDSIGKIFGRFVPLFERMLGDKEVGILYSAFDVDMERYSVYKELPPRPKIPALNKLPKKRMAASLRDGKLQVIVKIAEILLTPEKPKYNGGTWHIEGSRAERIVGTGIYYFSCENIKNSRLSFRAEVAEPLCQHDDHDGAAEIYGLISGELLVQVLGSVETLEYRCVVFPNTLQHQVQPFELEDPTKPGARKILAFFLVDPNTSIPSTSVIPPQQAEWMKTPMKFTDVEEVDKNIRSMLPTGMTLEEAKKHRLKLMKERAVPETPEYARLSDSLFLTVRALGNKPIMSSVAVPQPTSSFSM